MQENNFIIGNLLRSQTAILTSDQFKKLQNYAEKKERKLESGKSCDMSNTDVENFIKNELKIELKSPKQGGSTANMAYTSLVVSSKDNKSRTNGKFLCHTSNIPEDIGSKAGKYGVTFEKITKENGDIYENITVLANKDRAFIYPKGAPKVNFTIQDLKKFIEENKGEHSTFYLEQYALRENGFSLLEVCKTIREGNSNCDIVLSINEAKTTNIEKDTLSNTIKECKINRIGLDLDQFAFYFVKEEDVEEFKKSIRENSGVINSDIVTKYLENKDVIKNADFFITDGARQVLTIRDSGNEILLHDSTVDFGKFGKTEDGKTLIEAGSGLSGAGDTFFGALDGIIKSGETDTKKAVAFASIMSAIKISSKDQKVAIGGRLEPNAIIKIKQLFNEKYEKITDKNKLYEDIMHDLCESLEIDNPITVLKNMIEGYKAKDAFLEVKQVIAQVGSAEKKCIEHKKHGKQDSEQRVESGFTQVDMLDAKRRAAENTTPCLQQQQREGFSGLNL